MSHTNKHGSIIETLSVPGDDHEYPGRLDWLCYSDVTTEALIDDERALHYTKELPANRVIVAGSRSITNPDLVYETLLDLPTSWTNWRPLEIVHGGADGVDSIADDICRTTWQAPQLVTTFDPRWDKYLGKAGPLRNKEMARYADYLVAIWDGESTGTESMIDAAREQGLDRYIRQV